MGNDYLQYASLSQLLQQIKAAVYVASNQVATATTPGTTYNCSTPQRVFVPSTACTITFGEDDEVLVVDDNNINQIPNLLLPEFSVFTVVATSSTGYIQTLGETRATLSEAE